MKIFRIVTIVLGIHVVLELVMRSGGRRAVSRGARRKTPREAANLTPCPVA